MPAVLMNKTVFSRQQRRLQIRAALVAPKLYEVAVPSCRCIRKRNSSSSNPFFRGGNLRPFSFDRFSVHFILGREFRPANFAECSPQNDGSRPSTNCSSFRMGAVQSQIQKALTRFVLVGAMCLIAFLALGGGLCFWKEHVHHFKAGAKSHL
jgi:hypothetical protein